MTDRNFSAEIEAAIHEEYEAVKKEREAGNQLAGLRPGPLERKTCALQQEAAETFAAINGWRRSRSFTFLRLAGKSRSHSDDAAPLWRDGGYPFEDALDHMLWFNRDRKPVAIVTQPYIDARGEKARALARHYGLALHMPPNPGASWHCPGVGGTLFFVFTRPGTAVRFLPEQEATVLDDAP
jgi:hypothetical protein